MYTIPKKIFYSKTTSLNGSQNKNNDSSYPTQCFEIKNVFGLMRRVKKKDFWKKRDKTAKSHQSWRLKFKEKKFFFPIISMIILTKLPNELEKILKRLFILRNNTQKTFLAASFFFFSKSQFSNSF
jgi:molecular chaperone DnaK (HSP70)